ncbi:MAG: hypothetical protein ACTSQP_05765 [Promethearchaeota archaeon]
MVKYHLMYKNIKKETIKAIKEHWKQGFWRGDDLHKKNVFESLLRKLCEIYSIPHTPELIIDRNLKSLGCYIPFKNKIIMNKYSLITLLHEFKHLKDFSEGKIMSEENARGWSLSVMYLTNPKYFKNIVRRGLVKFIDASDIEE